jgi:hypothetical protein
MPRHPTKIPAKTKPKGKLRCQVCNCSLSTYNTSTKCFPCQTKAARESTG